MRLEEEKSGEMTNSEGHYQASCLKRSGNSFRLSTRQVLPATPNS